MDGAADGSNPDNYDEYFVIYGRFGHGLHHCLC